MENNGKVRRKNKRVYIWVPFFCLLPACTIPHNPEETTFLQGKL